MQELSLVVKYDLIKLSDSSEKPYALSLFIMSDGCRESNQMLYSCLLRVFQ